MWLIGFRVLNRGGDGRRQDEIHDIKTMALIYWILGFDNPTGIASVSQWDWYAGWPAGGPVIAVVAVVALTAAVLNLLPQTPMPYLMRAALVLLRLAGFAVLLMMLCQLELRMTVQREVRPKIAILTDTSGSMSLEDADGESRLQAARQFADSKLSGLTAAGDVVSYDFDWQLKVQRSGTAAGGNRPVDNAQGSTELYGSLAELVQRENDLQAVIVLTDGNDTTGAKGGLVTPLLAARGLPIYPVVFGSSDEPAMPDVAVTEGGAYVRLHDELRLTATVRGRGLKEQIVSAHLFQNGKKEPLATKENVRLGSAPVSLSFTIKPDKPGDFVYRIELEGVRDSVSSRTLAAEHRVQVVDSRIRVLYLDIPRDERKLLGHWLALDPVIDLSTLTLMPKGGWYGTGQLRHKNAGDGLPNSEADMYLYDVIIFGDIPRSYFRGGGDVSETKMRRLAEFVRRRGGGLVTLGGRRAYAAGGYQNSEFASLLPFAIEPTDKPQIEGKFKMLPTAVGFGHPLLRFDFDAERNREICFDLPTLDGCNRVGEVKPGASLLAVREMQDQSDSTEDSQTSAVSSEPLIAMHNVGKGRVLSLAMDTTWRWEMLRPKDSEDRYRRFWGNAIRALAPDPRITPREPQILRYQSGIAVGDRVKMGTRLVDTFFQPVRQADIAVHVKSPSGQLTTIYPRDGREAPGLYEYEIPVDEAGQWQVTTVYNEGEAVELFEAGESEEEFADPRARPDLMKQLAEATGGYEVSSDAPFTVPEGYRYTPETAAIALWNLPVTMLLLIAIVGLDCFIRKKRGMV